MIKPFLAACAVLATGSAAVAGPFVNVENNAGWSGNDFSGSVTDLHVGYEGQVGAVSWYLQGGPSLVSPENVDSEVEFSAKGGGSFAVTDKLGIYGELSGITGDDDNSYGTKIGAKYFF